SPRVSDVAGCGVEPAAEGAVEVGQVTEADVAGDGADGPRGEPGVAKPPTGQVEAAVEHELAVGPSWSGATWRGTSRGGPASRQSRALVPRGTRMSMSPLRSGRTTVNRPASRPTNRASP